ncbi:MAG: stress response translation initiation inhibitor YciH [Gammaproteobacteria bacterium]|jgi:translation initiation factor 1|nr:stress response translation initiation inhibitor YciH [Gammaproteobacteria bacterium]MBT6952113.1 stress response translation initiation inhibitor YciH [Gammaproteobacteria bacterium]MBT7174804.1 stress response translation initiation inhibitor YciH [Gammaproteobacteria bacterium]MBT7530965.1 stress response translation initiation inhibitor YciH [Gammaproteobacteria bacterium]MBT7724204.1 stress response translation initiation inhibitor YciH [Gammaproteobacteria bacterium]
MSKQRTVYSTDLGQLCPDCRQPVKSCQCQPLQPDGDGIVRLQRQTKGRNGKPVTLITGVPLSAPELKKLAGELKRKCGVGGSVEGASILIQGDKRPLLKELLEQRGFAVKLAGG